jgi:hypothetical protein
MNRSFDEKISREHFVIRVQEINPDGIWGTHPYNDEMVSFFAMAHIISIHEEIELDPSDPEHAKLIEEYEERKGKKATPDIQGEPKQKPSDSEEPEGGMMFVDLDNLEELAENTKRSFDVYRNLGQ